MSSSYSGDPSTSDLDYYRFLIGDTGELDDTDSTPVTSYVLTDEEVNFVLTLYTDHNRRLHTLFSALTIQYAKLYKNSLGPASEDPTSRLNYFRSQSEMYRKRTNAGSGIYTPTYNFDKIFTKGMHDND